eukprot:410055_1
MPELSRASQSRLSGKLDFFVKTEDGVQDTSMLGGVLSVLSIVLVIVLGIYELWHLFHALARFLGTLVTNVHVNSGLQDNYIPLYMDITFPRGRCSELESQAQNFRGSGATDRRPMQKFPINQEGDSDRPGCRFTGHLLVQRAGGAITFSVGRHNFENALQHEINTLTFGALYHRVPGQTEPLIGHKELYMKQRTVTNYNLHVIPHSYESRSGKQVKAFSYSVSTQVEPCEGGKCAHGMVQFSYDFSPLMIIDKETGQNILGFLTGLCAIAGGVCAISRLVVGFYSGYKAGKKD